MEVPILGRGCRVWGRRGAGWGYRGAGKWVERGDRVGEVGKGRWVDVIHILSPAILHIYQTVDDRRYS